jgi:hypothetical protein
MKMLRNAAAAAIVLLISAGVAYPQSQTITSFRYAVGPVSSFAAGPTDWIVLTGAPSPKVVKLTNITCSGTANSSASLDLILVKRSSADTGGTSATVTPVNLGATTFTAASSLAVYTVNPTLGTTVANIDAQKLNVGPPGSAGFMSLDFGTRPQAVAPVLRGTSQQLALNLNGGTVPVGLSLDCRLEITEQ